MARSPADNDATPFAGFHSDGFKFFRELHLDNSKAFWDANKSRYDQHVRGPLLALARELEGTFGESHVYRPHRDLRFSHDKRPYKERAAMSFGGRGPSAVGGQYLQIGAEGLFVGVGSYIMLPDQLTIYRRAVADAGHGSRLQAIVTDLTAAGYEVHGDALKRAPRGFDDSHPRADLLKRKGLFVSLHWEPQEWMYAETALEKIAQTFARAESLSTWFRARLT